MSAGTSRADADSLQGGVPYGRETMADSPIPESPARSPAHRRGTDGRSRGARGPSPGGPSRSQLTGAPVLFEDYPSARNLIGTLKRVGGGGPFSWVADAESVEGSSALRPLRSPRLLPTSQRRPRQIPDHADVTRPATLAQRGRRARWEHGPECSETQAFTRSRLSTSRAPGAAQAARSASRRSCAECTLPRRMIVPFFVSTSIWRASISALR